MDNSEPKDKYALVTGAAKGIGKASALELAKLGSNVVINYNSSHEEAEKTVHEIKKLGVKSMSVQADVGNLDQVNFMIKKINDELGQINILVNNAGIIDDGLMLRMSDEAWERVINTNLNGTRPPPNLGHTTWYTKRTQIFHNLSSNSCNNINNIHKLSQM